MNSTTTFNSIADAVNAHAKKMAKDGMSLGKDLTSQSVAEALQGIADAYASQLTSADDIITQNDGNPTSVADQLYFLLDVTEKKFIEDNPLTALAVDVDIATNVDLLGKKINDLEDDVTLSGNRFTGNLLYVDDYLGFSTTEGQYEGNYLAFHAAVEGVEGVTIKVKTKSGEYTLDPDGIMILQILNKHRPFQVIASKDGYADIIKTYYLDDLVLETEKRNSEPFS